MANLFLTSAWFCSSAPQDWDKPEHIPDPDAKKPEDWDEEMDGEWEPPVIQNPEYKVRLAHRLGLERLWGDGGGLECLIVNFHEYRGLLSVEEPQPCCSRC